MADTCSACGVALSPANVAHPRPAAWYVTHFDVTVASGDDNRWKLWSFCSLRCLGRWAGEHEEGP